MPIKEKTIGEIWDTLNEEQKQMVHAIVGYIKKYPNRPLWFEEGKNA